MTVNPPPRPMNTVTLKLPKVALKWDVEFTTVEYIDMQADRQAKTFILKSGAWKELCLKSFGW